MIRCRQARWRNDRGNDLGFSLLEMLLVVGLIALVTTISIPWVSRSASGIGLRVSAYELASQLRSARAAAQRSNLEHVIHFDTRQHHYWISGNATRRNLPAQIGVAVRVPDNERHTPSLAQIRFFPDGSSSGGSIRLKHGVRSAAIEVDWLSGHVRVRWN